MDARIRILGLVAAMAFAGRTAMAAEFPLATQQTVLGALDSHTTHAADTLLDVQRQYDIGYAELMAANRGVDPWLPGEGTRIVIPTQYILPNAPRRGIVINLGERRLYYFPPDGKHVETFPIGVGVEGKKTLIGTTTVVAKEKNPTWFPPPSIHQEKPELPAAVPAGPDNPLGAYAFRLGWANYLIHGTNKPDGVGRNVSHGCIHLYPEDIEHLFSEIPIGTSVRVVDQPVLTAWIDGQLYVAVHPSQSQTDEIDLSEPMTPEAPQDLVAQVTAAAGGRVNEVDWDAVNRAGLERSGIPVAVLSDAPVISSNNVGVAPQQSSAQQSAPQTGAEPPVAAAFQYVPGEEPRFFPAVPPGDREAASRVE
ncbi:MAG TPA: L,D-transpeptidase family protein [Stellaceae bacterium]|nr:L,D-transpeptidase family protein [Stellaceae bacterium]